MTCKQIAEQAGVSLQTVRKNVKLLGFTLARGKVAKDFGKNDSARILKACTR
jgi:hypothetical protein